MLIGDVSFQTGIILMETLSVGCVLCKTSFAPVIQPEEGQTFYGICCSSCTSKVLIRAGDPVRITFRDVLGLTELSLAHAIQDVLIDCPCGGTFTHDAGKRCPVCIEKIEKEIKHAPSRRVPTIWNVEKLKKWEGKVFSRILEKLETREETLAQLIEKFEAGKIDPEAYMSGIDRIRQREFTQVCAIQAWAMMLGPESAFQAAEDLDLTERYGTRIMVSIASALEMSAGSSVISILTKEIETASDPVVQKELRMYLDKIAGG